MCDNADVIERLTLMQAEANSALDIITSQLTRLEAGQDGIEPQMDSIYDQTVVLGTRMDYIDEQLHLLRMRFFDLEALLNKIVHAVDA